MWPSKVPDNKPNPDPANAEVKPPEKTVAELIADSIKPLVDAQTASNEALNKRLDVLDAATRKPEPKPADEGQPTSVLDDENVAFAQRLTPVIARQLELESRYVKGEIKAEYLAAGYGDLWAQFENDINQLIDSAPLVTVDGKPLRGDPQYVRNVVDMVFGRAARKAGMHFDGKGKKFFIETSNGGPENNGSAHADDGLSDGQRKVAARMGIPLDKVVATKAKLHFIN